VIAMHEFEDRRGRSITVCCALNLANLSREMTMCLLARGDWLVGFQRRARARRLCCKPGVSFYRWSVASMFDASARTSSQT